jgi:hypothetical protein
LAISSSFDLRRNEQEDAARCKVNVHESEMMPGIWLARRDGPGEQGVDFDGDRSVSDVSDDATVPFALSLSDDDPSAQQRVDQVASREGSGLGCRNLKVSRVDLELCPTSALPAMTVCYLPP